MFSQLKMITQRFISKYFLHFDILQAALRPALVGWYCLWLVDLVTWLGNRFWLAHKFNCRLGRSKKLFTWNVKKLTLCRQRVKRATEKNRSFALFKKTQYLQKRQKVVNFGQFLLNFLFTKSKKRAIAL